MLRNILIDAPGIHDVVRIEYDPGRSAHIALLHNRDQNATGDQKWSYIIATEGLRAGDQVQSFRQGIPEGFIPGFNSALAENSTKEAVDADSVTKEGHSATERAQATESSAQSLAVGLLRSLTLKPGNVLPLRLIPAGTVINTVALSPTGPGILVRSAGSFAQVVGHEDGSRYVQVRLQSGEVRKILRDCCATIMPMTVLRPIVRLTGSAGVAATGDVATAAGLDALVSEGMTTRVAPTPLGSMRVRAMKCAGRG